MLRGSFGPSSKQSRSASSLGPCPPRGARGAGCGGGDKGTPLGLYSPAWSLTVSPSLGLGSMTGLDTCIQKRVGLRFPLPTFRCNHLLIAYTGNK